MKEKIVTEFVSVSNADNFSEFPKINELLNEGWLVKNFNVSYHVKPLGAFVVAVLQKVDNAEAGS